MKDFFKKNPVLSIALGSLILILVVATATHQNAQKPKQVTTVHVVQKQETKWIKDSEFAATGKGTDVDEVSQSFPVGNGNIRIAYQVTDSPNAYASIHLSDDSGFIIAKAKGDKLAGDQELTVSKGSYTITVQANTPVNVQVYEQQ